MPKIRFDKKLEYEIIMNNQTLKVRIKENYDFYLQNFTALEILYKCMLNR